MRYLLLFLVVLIIGCSGSPTLPTREVQTSPWLGDDNDNSLIISTANFYQYDCAPDDVQDLWDRIYALIGDKQYEAIYGVDTGEMEILTNPFGPKWIDGIEFDYQYGFLVEIKMDGFGNVYTHTVTLIVEPLDTWIRRIKSFERSGDMVTAGIYDEASWVGISDRYLNRHPTTHYQFEEALTDCDIHVAESHNNIDVTGMNINDLTIWSAWFYPTGYDRVADEIEGYLHVQYTHNPTNKDFVQIWKMTMIVVA